MTLEPLAPERAVELYLDHRRNEVAAQTLRSHESRLQYFTTWCDEDDIENLNELTGRKLYENRIWRRNDGDLSKVSEKTQMATLRVFVKFLESIDAVEPDLHTKVQLPSLSSDDNVRTEMLEADAAERVLDYLAKYHYASLRHVVVTLAWKTAMRRGTMHALDVRDYHPDDQYIQTVHRVETPLKNQESGERYVELADESVNCSTTGSPTSVQRRSKTMGGSPCWLRHRDESTRVLSNRSFTNSRGHVSTPVSVPTEEIWRRVRRPPEIQLPVVRRVVRLTRYVEVQLLLAPVRCSRKGRD